MLHVSLKGLNNWSSCNRGFLIHKRWKFHIILGYNKKQKTHSMGSVYFVKKTTKYIISKRLWLPPNQTQTNKQKSLIPHWYNLAGTRWTRDSLHKVSTTKHQCLRWSFPNSSHAQVRRPTPGATCSANPGPLGDGPQREEQAAWASWMSSNGKREMRCRESVLQGLKNFVLSC